VWMVRWMIVQRIRRPLLAAMRHKRSSSSCRCIGIQYAWCWTFRLWI
jgi:hypothetical protein